MPLFSSLGDDPALQLPQPFDVINDIAIGEKYSFSTFLDDGGILTIETLPVTKPGKAGMEGCCYHGVSAGDFKFNIILQWPDNDKAENDYTVDVSMELKTENNIVQREEDGRHIYHLEGSNTNLYIPDQYYGHFRYGDYDMMKLEVVEAGFRALIQVLEVPVCLHFASANLPRSFMILVSCVKNPQVAFLLHNLLKPQTAL